MFRKTLLIAAILFFSFSINQSGFAQSDNLAIQEIYIKANQAFEINDFEECVRLCDNILIADPENAEANALQKKANKAIYNRDLKLRYTTLTSRQKGFRIRLEYRYVPAQKMNEYEETEKCDLSLIPDSVYIVSHEIRLLLGYRGNVDFFIWQIDAEGILAVIPTIQASDDDNMGYFGLAVRPAIGFTLYPFTDNFGLASEIGTDLGFKASAASTDECYEVATLDSNYFFNLLWQFHGWNIITGVGMDWNVKPIFIFGLEGW